MLRTTLTHPAILQALASSGHGGMLLIADGNYPVATCTHAAAERVYLNLRPGLVTVTDVLVAIEASIPIEAAHVMQPDQGEPEIFAEFRRLLPAVPLQPLDRFAFYERARQRDVSLAIATGEERLYANILLTIGVLQPPAR